MFMPVLMIALVLVLGCIAIGFGRGVCIGGNLYDCIHVGVGLGHGVGLGVRLYVDVNVGVCVGDGVWDCVYTFVCV